jgi:iron-sulfur cluster repair protein YtfE (RIC family)
LSQFFGGEAEDDLIAHTVVRERMARVVQLLAASSGAGRLDAESLAKVRSLVEAAKGLLASHLAKEDKLVFPLIDRMLNPDELEAVKGRLQRILLTRDLTDGAQGLQPLGR